jgi:hypothetical protein
LGGSILLFNDDMEARHLRQDILKGYTEERKDTLVVIRCDPSEVKVGELFADALRFWNMAAEADCKMEPEPDEITVWLLTPAWTKEMLQLLEKRFDRERALLLFPAGYKPTLWIAKIMAEGKLGPFVDIGMHHKALLNSDHSDYDLMSNAWMGRLWT